MIAGTQETAAERGTALTVHIHRANLAKGFTQIANAVLRDARLSLRAKGLLVQLLSHEDGWQQSMTYSQSQCLDGKDSIRSGFQELEQAGYAWRERRRDGKGRWAYDYHVTDEVRGEVGGSTAAAGPLRTDRSGQTVDGESAALEDKLVEEPLGEEPLEKKAADLENQEGWIEQPAPSPNDMQVYFFERLREHDQKWYSMAMVQIVQLNRAFGRQTVTEAMGRCWEEAQAGNPAPRHPYPFVRAICQSIQEATKEAV